MNKVICSPCKKEFKTNEDYLKHTCKKTGYKPTDPRHFGKRFLQQSKKALERGKSLTKKREDEINKMINDVETKDIQVKKRGKSKS